MLIYIYSRKSVYTGKGESIENQIEMCRQYITSYIKDSENAQIVIYEDEGFSGKDLKRPQFTQMMKDSYSQKPDYIVCYRLDRISRSVSDFAPLVEDLNDRDIAFVCIKEQFDTSTPMGRAMMYIASVFAQLERETIAERVRDNMMMLARTGRWLGGQTPTGFISEKNQEIIIDGKIKTSYKLKANPEEIKIVKLMYEKLLELRSVSGVSKYLISQGIKSKGGKFYSLLGIKEMLQNPVYCIADIDAFHYFKNYNADVCFDEKDCSDKFGLLSYNKRNYTKKSAPRQPIEKWIIAMGKHNGIVPGKKWVAVQTILEGNKPTNQESIIHNEYSLLSGLIRCGKCENRMYAKFRHNNPDLYDYICSSKMRGGMKLCDLPNLGGLMADDIVCKYLMDYIKQDSEIYKLLESLKQQIQKEETIDFTIDLKQQINKRNTEIDNLMDSLAQSNYSSTFAQRISDRVAVLEQEIKQLNEDLNAFEHKGDVKREKEIQMEMMVNILSSLKDNFDELTVVEKRTLIRLLVQKIVWDGEKLHIFIYGE